MQDIELPDKPRLGISSCLMGNNVRYDGAHKHNRYCTATLATLFDFEAICPELEAGMGVPRPTIHLAKTNDGNTIAITRSGEDVSEKLEQVFDKRAEQIAQLSGFIFTHKSPSCGVFRVKTYNEAGHIVARDGRGIFAQALINAYPDLPVEEAERLNDASLRENFLLRVFAYHQWQQLMNESATKSDVLKFYTRYKYVMLSHSPEHYQKIGKLLSNLKELSPTDLKRRFIRLFMQGLSKLANRNNHSNTLFHLLGYFKKYLKAEEKTEIVDLINAYKQGQIPLITPVTLLKHHLKNYPDIYLNSQEYFDPYPYRLGLRSSIQGK